MGPYPTPWRGTVSEGRGRQPTVGIHQPELKSEVPRPRRSPGGSGRRGGGTSGCSSRGSNGYETLTGPAVT